MNPIKRAIRALMGNPWLPVFIGIPFLAIAWLAANYVRPMGEDYYGLFALSIAAALIGSSFLGISLFRGDTVIRILAVLFLLSNWKIATEWIEVKPWISRTAVYPVPPARISVVDSRPTMEPKDGYTRIVLAGSDPEISFYDHRLPANLLAADQSYRFTFEETAYPYISGLQQMENGKITLMGQRHPPEPPDFMWTREILTVERDGSTIFDRTVCEVHHEKMERRDLSISYGLPDMNYFPPPLVEAKEFPHYREFVLGGCCVVVGRDTQRGFVCSGCVKAFKEWQSKNPLPVR
ncbi:MAG: hypothetical protein KF712_20780 [Akkermansiaceae bacterium]|nr:hypothetical protein [Akkermansiaceae bacterium]